MRGEVVVVDEGGRERAAADGDEDTEVQRG